MTDGFQMHVLYLRGTIELFEDWFKNKLIPSSAILMDKAVDQNSLPQKKWQNFQFLELNNTLDSHGAEATKYFLSDVYFNRILNLYLEFIYFRWPTSRWLASREFLIKSTFYCMVTMCKIYLIRYILFYLYLFDVNVQHSI